MAKRVCSAGRELPLRRRDRRLQNNFGGYTLLFFLFSFYGWLLETAHFAIRWGKLTDRGFLCLPLCPIYGFSMLAAGLALGSPRKGTLRPLFRAGKTAASRRARRGVRRTAAPLLRVRRRPPRGRGTCRRRLLRQNARHTAVELSYKETNLFGYITVDRTLVWGILLALLLTLVWEPLRENVCALSPAAKRRANTAAAALAALTLIDYAFNLLWLAAESSHFILFVSRKFLLKEIKEIS